MLKDGDKLVADYNLYLRTLEYKDLKCILYQVDALTWIDWIRGNKN